MKMRQPGFLATLCGLLLLSLVLSGTIRYGLHAESLPHTHPAMHTILQQSGIQDGGFEAGTPSTAWQESSQIYGSPLCYVGTCGTGPGSGPHTGDYWVWFGGTDQDEQAAMSQEVTIPDGTTALTFWLEIPESSGSATDRLHVSVNGTVLFTVTGADAANYAEYTQVRVPISAYADGGLHTIAFAVQTVASSSGRTSFFVDDVSLSTASVPPTSTPADPSTPTVPPPPTPTSTVEPGGPIPTVIQITPGDGFSNSETNVEISGANFVATPLVELRDGTTSIALRDITLIDSTRVLAVVPVRVPPGVYTLVVRNPGGQEGTLTNSFTMRSPSPDITDVIPNQGRADLPGELTIYGFNFLEGATVSLGTTPLTATRINASTLRGSLAAGSLKAGTYDLVVTNVDGSRGNQPAAVTIFDPSTADLFAEPRGLWTLPVVPRPGSATDIGLIVYRQGGTQTIPSVPVQFYLGDPQAGGTLLGEGLTAPIAPGDTGNSSSSVSWTPTTSGTVTLYALIDPDQTTGEPASARSNNVLSRTITVEPPTQDQQAPSIASFAINQGATQTDQQAITLATTATDAGSGVQSLLYIEYTYHQSANQWVPVQQTGWLPYATARQYTWSLQPQAGTRYLQAWVADADNNISPFPFSQSISYEPPQEQVQRNQARIYRYHLAAGQTFDVLLEQVQGDTDLYIWPPDWDVTQPGGGRPPWVSNQSSGNEQLRVTAPISGTYQVEVYGFTAATYRLAVDVQPTRSQRAVQQTGGEDPTKNQPQAPVVPLTSRPADRLPVAPPASSSNPTPEPPVPGEPFVVYIPNILR